MKLRHASCPDTDPAQTILQRRTTCDINADAKPSVFAKGPPGQLPAFDGVCIPLIDQVDVNATK